MESSHRPVGARLKRRHRRRRSPPPQGGRVAASPAQDRDRGGQQRRSRVDFHVRPRLPGHARDLLATGQKTAWVFDGDDLDERGKEDLAITPGFKNCRLALARDLTLSSLVTWLQKNASRWPTVTEYDARHQFRSEKARLEMKGIDAYKDRWPERQCSWPDGAHTHTDLIVDGTKVQFKTAQQRGGGNESGFQCSLYTSAGTSTAGQRLHDPYPAGSFDTLVAVAWLDDHPHFWIIPAKELEDRGYMRSESQAGMTGLTLHAPIGKQPDLQARRPADTWTRTYFCVA
mmetsp:Transcript_5896/g.17760  ORF Transcript_5896/g.17760 Transcript_5896/m.17760 type:complete len:287 (+) Transcript_5896:270-1130(+)